jgi:3-dehydroquinate synthase
MVRESLALVGIEPLVEVVPAGEASKSLEQANTLFERLIKGHFDRLTPVIAVGGGVVGDLAGFVASTYQRGVPFYQVPTTLLAQVDSSVGGKVAINHPLAKNMIGCFYQPRGVLMDPLFLRTLPEREWRCGLSELIKYGVILDEVLFASIENNLEAVLSRDPATMIPLVARACELKSQVVAKDEREGGLRAIMNFGHTIGHGIETVSGYGMLTHGEAVSIGMVTAARIAEKLGLLDLACVSRLSSLLRRAGLPVDVPAISSDALFAAIRSDKKNQGKEIRMVLPSHIGQVSLPQAVSEALIREALES